MITTVNSNWNLTDVPDLADKTFVITGGNTGIGFESARFLARVHAHVVIACRSLPKAAVAIGRIRVETPEANIEAMELDLASLESIRAFAQQANERLPRIDVLCNNAGVMALPQGTTRDGFETQFGTNHLGHFALTGLLFDKIAASAPSRIVTVSSLAHKLGSGEMNFDDLQSTRSYGKMSAYQQSKLANLLFAYELDRRIQAHGLDIKSVACHPGLARTDLYTDRTTNRPTMLMWYASTLVTQSATMGSLPEIYAATAQDVEGGDYIGPSGFFEAMGWPKKVRSSASSYDLLTAHKLWSISEELTGVRFLD